MLTKSTLNYQLTPEKTKEGTFYVLFSKLFGATKIV